MKLDNSLTLQRLNSIPRADFKIDKTNPDDIALKEYTDQFEAIMVKQLLDVSMKSNDVLFPKAVGSDIYKSMYQDTMSKELSGSFGFSEMLFKYLKENN
jgi:Rod binding domain-containing protein